MLTSLTPASSRAATALLASECVSNNPLIVFIFFS